MSSKEIDMSEKSLPALGGISFEDLKQTNQYDAEYWSARDHPCSAIANGGASSKLSSAP